MPINKFRIVSEKKANKIVKEIDIANVAIRKYSMYALILPLADSVFSFAKPGIFELKPRGTPKFIIFETRFVKLNNCEITPRPEGPKNTA